MLPRNPAQKFPEPAMNAAGRRQVCSNSFIFCRDSCETFSNCEQIKCDSNGEGGPQACSSCRRTGAECRFSRQPMKRGPSKGYIKELADRVSSLEGQIRHDAVGPDYPYVQDYSDEAPGPSSFHDGPDRALSRKRTFSQSEEFQYPDGPNHRPFQPASASRQSISREAYLQSYTPSHITNR